MESDQRQNNIQSLQILECLLQSLDRREEIFAAVEASESEHDAMLAIGKILGVGETRARFVLDMQVKRMTRAGRRQLTGQIAQLRSELEATS